MSTPILTRFALVWNAPELTVIWEVARLAELGRTSVPPFTVVSPVYELEPVSVSVPAPLFATEPDPDSKPFHVID